MNIQVQMLAFGNPGEIRTVEVPDHLWTEDKDKNLDLVFEYGQNDFQPQNHPSVSVGDIIELDTYYYIVRPFGFLGLTPDQYKEYTGMDRSGRMDFHF
jgi:hypothetical protein